MFTAVPAIIISNYSSYSYFSANYLSIYFSQIWVVIRSNLFCDEIVIIPNHIYAICTMKFVVAHTVETHSCASLQRQPIDFFNIRYWQLSYIPHNINWSHNFILWTRNLKVATVFHRHAGNDGITVLMVPILLPSEPLGVSVCLGILLMVKCICHLLAKSH